MTSRHKGRVHSTAGALSLLLAFLALIVFLSSGCAPEGSSPASIDSTPAAPPMKTERELLLELERRFRNPQAQYELAHYYHRTREWTKAEYRYNIALSQQPSLLAAQAGLVKLYIDQGNSAKAEQFASAYIRQASGGTDTTLRLAWEFENQGLNDYAMRCFRQALTEAPDSAETNKQMGLYYLSKGDNDRARQYLGRSFELNPRQPDVAGALGRLGVVVQAPEPQPQEDTADR